MKRPGYREALEWIVYNDDMSWLFEDEPIISVTAAMVQDLFGVERDRLFADLRKANRQRNGVLQGNAALTRPAIARNADRIDGYDRDDLGASPDY